MKKPTSKVEEKRMIEAIMKINDELAYLTQEITGLFDYIENRAEIKHLGMKRKYTK